MFFIENTPEHIRGARHKEVVKAESPKEECPRLILAPFSRPPQIIFDNVLIGNSCEKKLEVFNPSKQVQKIKLGRELPPGLMLHLPGEWLELEPESCYCLTLVWAPTQPIALRETIRFTNEFRGRYDVVIILKSVMNIKGRNNRPCFKTSPGKKKNKSSKRSPVAVYKKKSKIIYKTTKVKSDSVVQSTNYKHFKSSNKENMSNVNDYSMDSHRSRNPFDSPSNVNLNFDTSEIFSKLRKPNNENILQDTYDKPELNNILKPFNKQQCDSPCSDIFDNITFTPLKGAPAKIDKLNKGPQIILSMNSDSEFDDSLEGKVTNKQNDAHSIVCVTSIQAPTKWLLHTDIEAPGVNKKIPNTSSPKELNSPNFSINTEFSRISDVSFNPQRFSTERKMPKINNETQDILDDPNNKVSSDTYTKESPVGPMAPVTVNHLFSETRPQFLIRDNKLCRQTLFREYQQQRESYERHYLNPCELNNWQNELRADIISPLRSLSPPLQSIPEENTREFSDTHIFDKTGKRSTFAINRTFDKIPDRSSISSDNKMWSKRAIRAESELWKVPVVPSRKSLKPKAAIPDKASLSATCYNTSTNQNISLNQVGNVYSQSTTVDPFMSSTYFYDEEAVDKFESEFKRWLNCILTPPADLDSNVEQKIDVGKAWIENRNKEIPAAPTKEQVSSVYHNSHRLKNLRKAARTLLKSPEICQVFEKLNMQIEKKLIAIRSDKNLHLDVGLQKVIMELLLSYNPLWLRIGLEAIYGVVMPLKSNSDIEGLTTFIIQRLFKNPYLKNKHSKSNAPNILLPAYMEAVKKFTLKKVFMLVFFLDQAKQRKLISHDPCLFCRNATCKESREILIRFTRELIAGIGDITRHLRPLGYVVCHKQSFLDEYKYAVHNIAIDLRDGVRLTKVMEIILMRNGLLNQLRTPPISRLQKIHNVQVALNSLKEANFVIVGDISPNDIADGHREKTLSLMWQLIHVFRAPLFEKAAIVLQTWWRKKYEVIVEKRKAEKKLQLERNTAANIIQFWWRQIQYNRQVEWQMQQITAATITIQKFCRMWLSRTRMRNQKTSVLKIEQWYISVKMTREAKYTLLKLKLQREELRRKSATILQSHVRRWLCMRQYKDKVQKIVLIQSLIRGFLAKKQYTQLTKSVIYIQRKYRGKLLMRVEMKKLSQQRKSAIIIQSYYRMMQQRKLFQKIQHSVKLIKEKYIALLKMRKEVENFARIKRSAVLIQAHYRGKRCREHYTREKNLIVKLQRKVKAHLLMRKERADFLQLKKAITLIQKRFRTWLLVKKLRRDYVTKRTSAIVIQRHFRSHLLTKSQRNSYLRIRHAAIVLQKHYRSLLEMRRQRSSFLKQKNAATLIQRQYKAQILMKETKDSYEKLRAATVTVQRRFRAQMKMRKERANYIKIKASCITIQNAYRAYALGKLQKQKFLKEKAAAITIQNWFRRCKKGKEILQEYQQTRHACVSIQRVYRAYIIGKEQRKEYIRIRTATVCIQKYYRAYIEMKTFRTQYIRLKTATVTIQRFYKSYIDTTKQRQKYLQIKSAAQLIQNYYRRYRETKMIRQKYCELKKTTLNIQRRYRAICAMRIERKQYLRLKQSVITIQQKYRAMLTMRVQRQAYINLRSAAVSLQTRFRAQMLMKKERLRYMTMLKACTIIQRFYRAHVSGREQRQQYLKLKQAAVVLQVQYKALLKMRKERAAYLRARSAAVAIQRSYRAHRLMLEQRCIFKKMVTASVIIQRYFRAHVAGKRQRLEYIRVKTATITIQQWYRNVSETRRIRRQYLHLRHLVIGIQLRYKAKLITRRIKCWKASEKIQTWYRSILRRNECRNKYLQVKKNFIIVQACTRMYILRKRFLALKTAALTIQRYYRSYRQTVNERGKYIILRTSIITLQSHVRCFIERRRFLRIRSAVVSIQAAYRLKRETDLIRKRREAAALCIQKNVRKYIAQTNYQRYLKQVTVIQKIWRSKLWTRMVRCEFLQKRRAIVQLQALLRGHLVRKQLQLRREEMAKTLEERSRNRAASIIQALFRGHSVRVAAVNDARVAALRRRWREGALRSTQETLKERNDEALEVLRNMSDIETVIRAFRSLELLTEVVPMMYNSNAGTVVRCVYTYMSVTNRSISSIDVLRSAAAILVNMTRYRVTGPKIYSIVPRFEVSQAAAAILFNIIQGVFDRDRIEQTLKYMWRFSNSETQLFCTLATYLWLFAKYDGIREDLTEFLHMTEYYKILVSTKGNIERMKRMASNTRNKVHTPQSSKFVSHTGSRSLNCSVASVGSRHGPVLPALEPDYGIVRADQPRYFEDAHQAITCLFKIYNL